MSIQEIGGSIFNGDKHIIPMADVSHIEKHWYSGDELTEENLRGYLVIMKQTTWNAELDCPNNNPYLCKEEGEKFLFAWCQYRHELENGIESCQVNIEPIVGVKEKLAQLKLTRYNISPEDE
jgi:hypothetical protein